MKTRALMYHDVVADGGGRGGFDGAGPDVYAVTASGFRDQLDAIAAAVPSGPARGSDLLAGTAQPPWLITFDDGGSSARVAGDELARHGWSGHFFVVTDLVGTPGFVGWDDVRALAAQGHTIGSHTRTHPDRLSACSPQQLRDEWAGSVAAIAEAVGQPTLTASVPGGYYSPAVGEAAAAAGIRVLFTSEPTATAEYADGCLLVGRYAVRRSTTARQAAAAAAGDPRPWGRQRAAWTARAVAKKASGRHYRRIRAALLARRPG
jgi:peptidoglycan/xylan/chitin deacetylase (PgdA/CDA1 family)